MLRYFEPAPTVQTKEYHCKSGLSPYLAFLEGIKIW